MNWKFRTELCYVRSIARVVEFEFKHSNTNKGIWRYIVKMKKQKAATICCIFLLFYSKVSNRQGRGEGGKGCGIVGVVGKNIKK